jgi:hypothetical protein
MSRILTKFCIFLQRYAVESSTKIEVGILLTYEDLHNATIFHYAINNKMFKAFFCYSWNNGTSHTTQILTFSLIKCPQKISIGFSTPIILENSTTHLLRKFNNLFVKGYTKYAILRTFWRVQYIICFSSTTGTAWLLIGFVQFFLWNSLLFHIGLTIENGHRIRFPFAQLSSV